MKKVWIIIVTTLVSLWLLLPSLLPETSSLQKFLPSKKLALGLDLKGGIHVVLGVEIEKALHLESDKFARDLESRLKEDAIQYTKLEKIPGTKSFNVELASDSQADKFKKILKDYFYQALMIEESVSDTVYRLGLEPSYEDYVAKNSLEQARQIIRNRVDEFGVAEPVIQIQGSDRILVQLPGVQDPERAVQLIGKTALLEFKAVEDTIPLSTLDTLIEKGRKETGFKNNFTRKELTALNDALKKDLPAGTEISFEKIKDPRSQEVTLRPFLLKSLTVLTGQALEDARVTTDPTTQKPQVSLRFNKTGAEAFEKVTSDNVGKLLAIVLDGSVMSAPVIRERIPAASAGAVISLGSGNRDQVMREARDLALVLRSGALPAPVEVLENRTVGASLGEDSIQSGKFSALLAILLVGLFMLLYYRWSGLLADSVLVFNVILLMAAMALFQATLTLPGIAGIVLTLGMAVDANVIIFERIKEELRTGKKVRAAVETGYQAAHSAIFDSNLTTVIAGVVLYNFGSGPIRGFAVTLLIGIISSYVSAVWFSQWIYEWLLSRKEYSRLSI